MTFGAFGLVACGGDAAGPAPASNPDVLWSLSFQWPAVNLALTPPYDTVQLTAIPRTATGVVLSDTASVRYTTADSAVSVSATGRVTARFVTAGARVVAHLTVGGITLTDTAVVQVTETPLPAPLDTLSIQLRPGGLARASTNVDAVFGPTIPVFATTTAGDVICEAGSCPIFPVLVHFASSDSTVASIDQTGYVTPKRVGRVTLFVSTFAYGVTKTDSLSFSVGYPARLDILVNVDSTQEPLAPFLGKVRSSSVISVSGQAFVSDYTGQPLEVSIPGPAHGVHFLKIPNLTQVKDTLQSLKFVRVQFDSVGTYTLTYRLLSTGVSVNDSYTVRNFP
jgi:hypothetical protein